MAISRMRRTRWVKSGNECFAPVNALPWIFTQLTLAGLFVAALSSVAVRRSLP